MQGFSLDLRAGFWGLWLVLGAVAAVFEGVSWRSWWLSAKMVAKMCVQAIIFVFMLAVGLGDC